MNQHVLTNQNREFSSAVVEIFNTETFLLVFSFLCDEASRCLFIPRSDRSTLFQHPFLSIFLSDTPTKHQVPRLRSIGRLIQSAADSGERGGVLSERISARLHYRAICKAERFSAAASHRAAAIFSRRLFDFVTRCRRRLHDASLFTQY